MKSMALLLTLILFLTNISALCEEGQIDINSATKEELMNITGLGGEGIIAQRVIDARPFSSVDDLMRVSGIKEAKLAGIKSQGLACVSGDEKNNDIEVDIEININNTINKTTTLESSNNFSSPREKELQAINLNPKAIKSEENSQISGKGDYTIYGLLAFGVLLGLLFLIKNLVRKRYKNEFE